MKRLARISVLAAALAVAAIAPAEAHESARHGHHPSAHYNDHNGYYIKRSKRMPRWLKRKHGFRNWYSDSRFKRNRRLAWVELYEIYRWERRYGRYDRFRDHHARRHVYRDRHGHRYDDRDDGIRDRRGRRRGDD